MNNDTTISPGKTRIGWIGTGVMGHSMAGHLIDAGYSMTVMNRTPAKAKAIVDAGATLVDSPAKVAAASDIVFTIVGMPDDVESVILGDAGILSAIKPGGIIVDMTTSRPSLAEQIAKIAAEKKVSSIDAPVSGGDIGAKAGKLSIMIGGDESVAKHLSPLFNLMGQTIVYQGGPGRGQHAKMANQILVASGMVAICEALLYASKAGLDLTTTLKSVSSGAAGSWALSNLGPRIVDGDYEPGFYVEHFIKDMGIALDESRRMNLCIPGLALAHQLYQSVAAQGHQKKGTQALMLALKKANSC
jgi:3-hydroxyisobutyrate dehydrogenase